MNAMNNLPSQQDDMGDFNPPPPPTSAGVEATIYRDSKPKEGLTNISYKPMFNDNTIPTNTNQLLPPSQQSQPIQPNKAYSDYYNYSYNNNTSSDKDILMEKINYMIHLLEEQQDEKSGSVTEEVILYSFLGIFIIFIVDSFYYVGKYTR